MAEGIKCPVCGAVNAPGAITCWLCDGKLAAVSGGAGTRAPLVGSRVAPTRPDGPAKLSFSLSTLMLVMTLIAVVCGMLSVAPGLGVLLAILSLPVLIRTIGVVHERQARGIATGPAKRVLLFLGSLLASLVIVVVVAIASVGTFCGVCLGIYAVSEQPGGQYDVPTAIFIALAAAAVTTIGAVMLSVKWIKARWWRDARGP